MPDAERNPLDMDKLVSLCKRRGFIFPGSDLYGGLNGTWDYGPLGVELKRNIKDAWWRAVVLEREDVVGLDAAILMNPQVWVASGHVAGFTDPMVDCKSCHHRFREDHVANQVFISEFGHFDFSEAHLQPLEAQGQHFLLFAPYKVDVTENGFVANPLSVTWSGRAGTRDDAMEPAHLPSSVLQGLSGLQLLTRQAAFPRGSGTFGTIFQDTGLPAGAEIEIHLGVRHGAQQRDPVRLTGQVGSRVKVVSHAPTCPDCGGELTDARQFNLMFRTFVGPVEDAAAQVYLRPETAQGIFVNFQNVQTTSRKRVPFGIAQIGKAFRNEINPRNFTFRSREFEQMELEFFCKPGSDEQWHQHWVQERFDWYLKLGVRKDRLRLRQHAKEELAHYAKDTYDIEYLFPWGWGELEGIANRTDFDLKQHQQFAGKSLEYFDDETKEHYIPYVVEPSAGADRATLAFLIDAYAEDAAPDAKGKEETRIVLRLHPALAPVKVAVLPLSRNEKLRPKAREVFDLVRRHFHTDYDDAQSIGRRYRRQDEVGTPLCVTVDFQTVEEDNQVTIRERDSMQQARVPIGDKGTELVAALRDKLAIS